MIELAGMLPPGALAWAGGAFFPVAVGLGSSATHCAGMCGPIHLFLASKAPHGGVWRYHAGRIAGYTLLGAAAGLFGNALAGGLTGGPWGETVKASSGWLLAALYAYFGLQLLGLLPRNLRLETQAARLFPARAFGRMAARDGGAALLFPAGLMASLLPCPSTHAVLLFAVGLGDPSLGAAAMAALGFSTLPFFALVPQRLPAAVPMARHYGTALGMLFLGLSAWRIYGAAFAGTPACH